MSVRDSDCSDTDISRHSAHSGSFICLPTYNLKDKSSMIRGFANLYSSLFISDDDLQFTLRVFKMVPIYKLVVQEKTSVGMETLITSVKVPLGIQWPLSQTVVVLRNTNCWINEARRT